jgi:hypothetical protein
VEDMSSEFGSGILFDERDMVLERFTSKEENSASSKPKVLVVIR